MQITTILPNRDDPRSRVNGCQANKGGSQRQAILGARTPVELVRTAVLAFIAALTLGAGVQSSAQDLPDARAVLDRWAEAIGGTEAWESKQSMRVSGTVAMLDAGISGSFHGIQIEGLGSFMELELAGVGAFRHGFTDGVAWQIDPMSGPRIMEGEEAVAARDGASFHTDLRRPSDIAEAATTGMGEVNGEPCYELRVVRASGRERTECYQVTTGLRLASTSVSETPGGPVASTTHYQEWSDVKGLMVPTRVVIDQPGSRMVMTTVTVEFDDGSAADVALPEAVQPLLD